MDGLLRVRISIHALLAESDRAVCRLDRHGADFYPRSPCGERRGQLHNRRGLYQFLSTLSLRRATGCRRRFWRRYMHFYPRSPCGERHTSRTPKPARRTISIHALLAESDCFEPCQLAQGWNFYPRSPCGERRRCYSAAASHRYFYPRSPCGERRTCSALCCHRTGISIHALLAESDQYWATRARAAQLFLSTLSLRRAT